MGDIQLQIEILVESLENKQRLLEEILSYTKEQAELLAKETLDLRSFNNIMKNKQIRIEKLVQIDDGFEQLFNRVRGPITAQPNLYKELIKRMKTLIQVISDLGVDIQVQEERNKQQFNRKNHSVKGEAKTLRSHKSAMDTYQTNYNNHKQVGQPHFFDSKK